MKEVLERATKDFRFEFEYRFSDNAKIVKDKAGWSFYVKSGDTWNGTHLVSPPNEEDWKSLEKLFTKEKFDPEPKD
jgi:hypothetical protein